MSYWLDQLKEPVDEQIGLTEDERQGIYNLGRRQMQGAYNTAAETMREKMGGRGFRAGDSGVADTAVGQIISQGAERLGAYGQEIAVGEAKNRFQQKATIAQLNQQRLLGAGGLENQANQIAASSAAARAAQKLASKRFRFDKRRWRNEFGASQQQQQFTNFYNIWRSQMGDQSDVWNQWGDQAL